MRSSTKYRLMRFRSVQTAKLDPLDRHLESADAATVALFREVLESASERLSILWRAGKTAHIERSLAAGACTDAALALLELEMPNWKIRRLVNEGGEWLCSLSRRPGVPTEFDDMVEARHALLMSRRFAPSRIPMSLSAHLGSETDLGRAR